MCAVSLERKVADQYKEPTESLRKKEKYVLVEGGMFRFVWREPGDQRGASDAACGATSFDKRGKDGRRRRSAMVKHGLGKKRREECNVLR